MIRVQAIELIKAKPDELPDKRIDMLAELADAWTRKSTVYETLSDADKTEIDTALHRLDRGEGIPSDTVRARLDAKLKAAGV